MTPLAICQQRHDAALPPGHCEGDDPVDTMLATDPAFALTGANIDEGLGDLDGSVHRIAADLLANYLEAEGKAWEARAGLEFVTTLPRSRSSFASKQKGNTQT